MGVPLKLSVVMLVMAFGQRAFAEAEDDDDDDDNNNVEATQRDKKRCSEFHILSIFINHNRVSN